MSNTEQGAARQASSSRDWIAAAGIIISLVVALLTVGRWQGQIESKLGMIEARLTSIDQSVSPVAEKMYQHALQQQQLEARVRALETERKR